MTGLSAPGFDAEDVRRRARLGPAAAFPDVADYGRAVYGGRVGSADDVLSSIRLVPPVFMPQRLEKLIELGREPRPGDVELACSIGGFAADLPCYISAFGSTQVAGSDLGIRTAEQAGRLAIPMVVGENVGSVNGYGRLGPVDARSLLHRIQAYAEAGSNRGGVVVQQSTEDADAEVWNLVYSDPTATALMAQGRLAFELKVGQGAKPGLGGLTVLPRAERDRLAEQFDFLDLFDHDQDRVLRCGTPGTFTAEILRQQIRLMRNNFPRCRIWVKLPPGRDIAAAAETAWAAGADAVTVDGAEGGTGWAPRSFLDQVGLPLAECLRQIGPVAGDLLASGGMYAGARAAICLALGARAVGLGRAALLAVDAAPTDGLRRLVRCLKFELQLLISALGKYDVADLDREDLWLPADWPVAAAAQLGSPVDERNSFDLEPDLLSNGACPS